MPHLDFSSSISTVNSSSSVSTILKETEVRQVMKPTPCMEIKRPSKKSHQRVLTRAFQSLELGLALIVYVVTVATIGVWLYTTVPTWASMSISMQLCYAQNTLCWFQGAFFRQECNPFSCADFEKAAMDEHLPTSVHLDYVLAVNGGSIVEEFTSPTLGYRKLSMKEQELYESRGFHLQHVKVYPPPIVINSEVRIARCWLFAGSTGHIAISLSEPIIISHLSFHHPDHRELSASLLS
ncbi:hypothetical protein E1B28_006849 [Marasmius oreades]|uniref:SUN domain-containing protein n=1 Tax=Marasmius oreades TaxID=181124 RepID=A0A9P8AAA8_9AGAR|nr:uncharacterized protein E1B28_006849 [Marasmius oreades]KAG7096176.1 hypothetical protein E1B28_006849 [Marasmius oreades]